MATLQGSGVPRIKLESGAEQHIKPEPMDDSPSPFVDDEDMYEDAGDLDFSQAQQQLWLSHIPRSLWETLSKMDDEEEIEIGRIRVEGPDSHPSRVSLLLNQTPALANEPKEYNLFPAPPEKQRSRRPGSAFVFAEKDLPGYKAKVFSWDEVDDDGNPGQTRSYLYERNKREQKRKENKGRFVPYAKRPIPKQTMMKGTVTLEFEAVPVKNAEYYALENKLAADMLRVEVREGAELKDDNYNPDRITTLMSTKDRQAANKAQQAKRTANKENRSARVSQQDLIDKLLNLFREHRIWGLRDLKAKVNQPEMYLRETLQVIATMHNRGDFNGKWELKQEYKDRDAQYQNPTGSVEAPKVEGESDVDMNSGGGEDDDDEMDEDDFENV